MNARQLFERVMAAPVETPTKPDVKPGAPPTPARPASPGKHPNPFRRPTPTIHPGPMPRPKARQPEQGRGAAPRMAMRAENLIRAKTPYAAKPVSESKARSLFGR